jgi:hypothetical protein
VDEETDAPAPSYAAARMSFFARQMEENKWGHNLLLIGDDHWSSFRSVEDVGTEVIDLESKSSTNFRDVSKPGETLDRLYDDSRGKLLFAVPPRISKIAISIGTRDLLDGSLCTLKEASLEEVRLKNEVVLSKKALALRDMAAYLLNQRKTVILLLPPIGEDRCAIHQLFSIILQLRILVLLPVSTMPYVVTVKNCSQIGE